MPISRVFVTRFFQLATRRRFAEAERVLERIQTKIQETEWNKGYFQALTGILLTLKTKDEYAFMSNLDLSNETDLKKYRKDFLQRSKKKILEDYDRGFFSAWADYMRATLKTREKQEK